MTDDEKKLLKSFQYDGVDYLYEQWLPRQDNLFMLSSFRESYPPDTNNIKDGASTLKYRINSVKISGSQSLTIDDVPLSDRATGYFGITNASKLNQLTIEWKDDAYHSIYRLHQDWLSKWYSRTNDCVISGIEGKFYNLTFVMYQYTSKMDVESVGELELINVMPVDIGLPVTLDYSNPNNESVYSVSYRFHHIVFKPVNALCGTEKDENDSASTATGDWENNILAALTGGSINA